MYKHLLTGIIGVIDATTHEEIYPYIEDQMTYCANKPLDPNNPDDFAAAVRMVQCKYEYDLLTDGRLAALGARPTITDVMYVGITRLPTL